MMAEVDERIEQEQEAPVINGFQIEEESFGDDESLKDENKIHLK